VKIRLNKEEELDDGVYAAIESGRSMSRFIANTFRDFYSTELGEDQRRDRFPPSDVAITTKYRTKARKGSKETDCLPKM